MKDFDPTSPHDVMLAIAWYRPEEWPKLLAVSADRDSLEQTHAEWLQDAQKTFLDLLARGIPVKKVDVRIDDLIAWCGKRRRPVDGESRSEYAAFKLRQTP
jgi:hypothetical protein